MQLIDRFDLETETGVLMAEALLQATRDPSMTASDGRGRGLVERDCSALACWWRRSAAWSVTTSPPSDLRRCSHRFLDGFLIQRMAEPDLDAETAAETLIALLSPPGEETP